MPSQIKPPTTHSSKTVTSSGYGRSKKIAATKSKILTTTTGNKPAHADRRGISAIKKSEAELQDKVKQYQAKIEDAEKANAQLHEEIQAKNIALIKVNKELDEMKDIKAKAVEDKENFQLILENHNIDPESHSKLSTDLLLKNDIDSINFTMDICKEVFSTCDSIESNIVFM